LNQSEKQAPHLKTQLCWFRTDLRICDNPALSNALSLGPTRAIYIATPTQWQLHNDAKIKLDFWRRNLNELERALQELNVDLLFFQVDSYKEIPHLLQKVMCELEISQLHYNCEYPLNEKRRDELVDTMCAQQGIIVSSFHDQLLTSPKVSLNQSGLPFKVFTPFARKALDVIHDCSPLYNKPATVTRNAAKLPQVHELPRQRELADISWPRSSQNWKHDWPAGEAAARERLEKFSQYQISAYKDKRDIPSLQATSQLSAYLAAGIISVADCWRTAQKYSDCIGVETWKNELLWREFYRHIVYHFPHVCMYKAYRQNTDHIPWRHDTKEFESWCRGQTGYPLVDAGMRQLLSKGWMHNRLRMVTAMFLSKHLLIDWRWGERWFMQNLIDGDFASNNGGWQWSASTGVDAVPYFRLFNPVRQSQRFDAEGSYIRHFVPELAALSKKFIHEPANSCPENYPEPLVEHKFARARALNAFKNQIN
jgi:deoxyribodipyrimidine photo-lyase